MGMLKGKVTTTKNAAMAEHHHYKHHPAPENGALNVFQPPFDAARAKKDCSFACLGPLTAAVSPLLPALRLPAAACRPVLLTLPATP
jgi:hypothetical protein